MTSRTIHHILFDLGGTLMYELGAWNPIFEQADNALARSLETHNIKLESKTFRQRLNNYYEQRDKDFKETTNHFVLQQLLKELGHAEVEESIIRTALDAMYSITQGNWKLENDTIETIQNLRAQNYRLGILSNAGDDKDVQELINKFEIRHYFDFVLTSAACYYRKPHPRAFEFALAHWNIDPEEAIMIGDSLEADIYGANQLKMKTIWITRRAKFNDEEIRRFKPDFSLRKLKELLPTLDRISIKHI